MLETSGAPTSTNPESIQPRLGLWDAVSIIIGIVIGTAVFRSASDVFANSPGPGWAMALWLVGGVLSWCGAVCYAELATTYPRDGGDYVYLTRAFGPWCGFLFGWAQLTTVLSGNIAIMAYAFADYGEKLWPQWKAHGAWLTVAPIIVLSILNAAGVVVGKFAQNVLTVGKILGLVGLVLAGVIAGEAKPQAANATDGLSSANLGLALVFVLYAYGGWNHAAYVAAEVRNQRRNLPRALFIGIGLIVVIYLAVNAAYLAVLGFDGARTTRTPAADVMHHALGAWGGRLISLIVMLSALGAINGMILTGTRIYAVWGADYRMIHWLGAWNRRTAAPVAAIALQAAIAVLLVLLVGTEPGRGAFDTALRAVGLDGLPWELYAGGFEMLVASSAPIYWGLCFLTCLAVFVLRAKDRTIERPFRIPMFPLPPLFFAATCALLVWSSASYAKWLVLLSLIPLAIGAAAWFIVRKSALGTRIAPSQKN